MRSTLPQSSSRAAAVLSRRKLLPAVVLLLHMSAIHAKAETLQVTIEKMAFSPVSIDAKIGDTIEWVNKDFLVHTATVKEGWEVMIPAGKSASLVLTSVGTVQYYCRLHPNMKASLTVKP